MHLLDHDALKDGQSVAPSLDAARRRPHHLSQLRSA
jgi:hypothetical protein